MTESQTGAPRQYRLLIGADAAGIDHKKTIAADLAKDPRVSSVVDVSSSNELADDCSYSHVGILAGQAIARGDADRAVLICGTGIGMAISANKVPGVRATVAHDGFSVERSILSNDCQVLTMGQRVIGIELARRLVREWLGYHFDPTSHSAANIDIITGFESDPAFVTGPATSGTIEAGATEPGLVSGEPEPAGSPPATVVPEATASPTAGGS